ncbi:short chain dehydrogenase [Fusarium albosuccineum]|uniref:Short chain dehydrogenase n=1 Tax=Fusarium albosuccineum TaxID=1237068 RepID=A0A8H4LQH8_9HYPO|nr:short chain dehydrogenase [Fusarium albosuccineum]
MAALPSSVVVIGVGGVGLAVARRLGVGRRIIIADYSEGAIDRAATTLRDDGHDVETRIIDISDYGSVHALAKFASSTTRIQTVVNAAGISPSMGNSLKIYEVTLLGAANVIDAFLEVMPPGSSLVSVSSGAGHFAHSDSPTAYAISKWGTIVRVQGAVREGQRRGVRLNSVSLGWVATPMLQKELAGEWADHAKAMIKDAPISRPASTNEIAGVVAFLSGPEASFIQGADLLVDGGTLAASRVGGMTL